MGKIPNYIIDPFNPEALTDQVLYEWSDLGLHQDEVHRWSCGGHEMENGLTDRVDYLLEYLDCMSILEPLTESPLHPDIILWRSIALMTINCINSGSVPHKISQ